jgi:hypothetical protein
LAYSIFISIVILFVYFVFLKDINSTGLVLFAMSFLIILYVLPVIILHLQYYLHSRNTEVIIDEISKEIAVCKQGDYYIKKFTEIESIKFYATSGHISTRGSSLWYTFDPYRYYKIVFTDKTCINITCLMGNQIDRQIEIKLGKDADRIFRPIPLIY